MNPEIARTSVKTSWRYACDIEQTAGFYHACRWALRIIAALFVAALITMLAGCASPALEIPKTVSVATPVPCIAPADKPARPELLSDGDILLLDSYRAVYALWGDRLARQDYERSLEAIVEGCSRIPAVR